MTAPYTRNITTPPAKAVTNGAFNFGCYKQPFKEINFLEASRPYRLPLPKKIKGLQLREWQAFQIGNPDYFIMVAIYNAKKLSLAQFIFYNKKTKEKWRYERKVPAWSLQVPNSLYETTAQYKGTNFLLHASHNINAQLLNLRVNIQSFKDLPSVKGFFGGNHDVKRYEPMVVCMPFSEKRAMYSHKCLMPLEGELEVGEERIHFNPTNSFLIIDDHKGYYPFPTRYDWVTAAGRQNDGSLIGFNLTHNQVLDPETYNENALWLDGILHPLPPIQVQRPNGVKNDWRIKDKYGMVDLTFTPVVHTAVDVNLLLFRSKYQGPYGYFNGYLMNQNGDKIQIENMFGMGEDFYLRV